MSVTRRNFLKTAASAAAIVIPATSSGNPVVQASAPRAANHGIELLRRPDSVRARLGVRDIETLQYAAGAWTCPGVRVSAEPTQTGAHGEVPVSVTNDGTDLTYLHLRWNGRESEGILSLGDHWERSYGDLEWRGHDSRARDALVLPHHIEIV